MSDVLLNELEQGTVLNSGAYVLNSFLDSNEFGIKYAAETDAGEKVVIKEFFPNELCQRKDTGVEVRKKEQEEEFINMRNGFMAGAETLRAIDNPNVVNVVEFFEENATAYMVMQVADGIPLSDIIEQKSRVFSPDEIFAMLTKLLRALHDIHSLDILHRDIDPGNINVSADGIPQLVLDFGTFKDRPSKGTRAVSKIASKTNHYAAMEIRSDPDKHAPAADIYSLAASFYFAITGAPPAASMERVFSVAQGQDDPYEKLSGRFTGYPIGVLETLDMALSLFVDDRIRSASEWLRHLRCHDASDELPVTKSLFRPAERQEMMFGVPRKHVRSVMVLTALTVSLVTLLLLTTFNVY